MHPTIRTRPGRLAAATITLALAPVLSGCASTARETPSGSGPVTQSTTTIELPTSMRTTTRTAAPALPASPQPTAMPGAGPRSGPMSSVAVPAMCTGRPASPEELQAVTDAGHSPWRVEPKQEVLRCLRQALGEAQWAVRPSAAGQVDVSEPVTDLHARFTLKQPVRRGPGGIWQITSVTADRPLTLPPACAEIENPRVVGELLAAQAQGHQPWRGDPLEVVGACVAAAFGGTGIQAKLTAADTYEVTADARWAAHGQFTWRTSNGVRLPFVTSLDVVNLDD